jgi:hypothetical protein
MKNLIHNAVFSMGYSVIPHTEYADVRRLITSLKPQDCGRDLIRIGGSGDGGYLIPDDLKGIEYCFSPGVSTVANFENHLADLGIKSFMADYSVSSPPINRPEFIFDKKFLGSTESEQFLTLPSWKQKYLGDYRGDLLLQMDIEGSEYEVILNTPDEFLDQFRIIVIEFHQLHRLFEPFAYKLFDSCFRKLSKYFYVAHLHPNNSLKSIRRGDLEIPRIVEFTFYNKKRAPHHKDVGLFPHPLDQDCTPENKPIHLPRCWYSTV